MVGESAKKLRFKVGDQVVVIRLRGGDIYPRHSRLNKVGTIIEVRESPSLFDYRLSFGGDDEDACNDGLLKLADNQIFNDLIDLYYDQK